MFSTDLGIGVIISRKRKFEKMSNLPDLTLDKSPWQKKSLLAFTSPRTPRTGDSQVLQSKTTIALHSRFFSWHRIVAFHTLVSSCLRYFGLFREQAPSFEVLLRQIRCRSQHLNELQQFLHISISHIVSS